MNRALKKLGVIVAIIVLFGIAIYLYIFREQTIAIDLIPNEFKYCNEQIWGNNSQYLEIVNWLKENKDGWVVSYVTYAPDSLYSHPAFKVNVLKDGVIVSYKTDYGYPQYAKTINHSINLECTKDS